MENLFLLEEVEFKSLYFSVVHPTVILNVDSGHQMESHLCFTLTTKDGYFIAVDTD